MTLLRPFLFYLFGVMAVLLSLGVVCGRNLFRSALALAGALSVVAALFALLGADFLAVGQLLIYVGGIMVLMLFVVMFSQGTVDGRQSQTNRQWGAGIVFSGILGWVLIAGLLSAFGPATLTGDPFPTSAPLGRLLLGTMVLPFEVVSLVLLAALVGAVYFSHNPKEPPAR